VISKAEGSGECQRVLVSEGAIIRTGSGCRQAKHDEFACQARLADYASLCNRERSLRAATTTFQQIATVSSSG
jgi:hypothetical protein